MRESTDTVGRLARPVAELGNVPALDGVRALAVVAVLVFHGRLGFGAGGFLGVSVFFTLSGFLITSLLLRRWNRDGRVGLGGFWSRRFRRLLPAAWLTMLIVVAMGLAGAWDTEQLRSLRGDVPWSMAQLVNWHFIAGGVAYGDSFTPPSPLEHFWSLAIEQQAYVVVPVLLAALLWIASRRADGPVSTRRAFGPAVLVLTAGLVASAVANGLLARTSIDRAYFGSDTRAAELLVGALLAFAMVHRVQLEGRTSRRLATIAGLVGLVTTLVLFVVVELADQWLYPWGLLLCAVSTAALLVAVLQPGPLQRAFSWAPLPALGRISYGVYLLHWPVFLWLTPARTGWSDEALFVPRVALSIAAAALMARWWEQPVRHGQVLRRPTAAVAGLGVAAVALLGGIGWATRDLPPPLDYLQARGVDEVEIREVPTTTLPTTTLPTTTVPPTSAAPVPDSTVATTTTTTTTTVPPRRPQRVLLVGDSIAATLETPLADALVARGIAAASAVGPGCGIVTGFPATEDGQLVEVTRECDRAVPDRQRNAIARVQPDLVLVVSSWESVDRIVDGVWHPFGSPAALAELERLYLEAFDRLGAGGAAVAVATMPAYVEAELRTPNARELGQLRTMNQVIERSVARWPGTAGVVPFAGMVCPTEPCPRQVDGIELRARDGVHFVEPGARWAAERLADHLAGLDLNRM